MATQHAHVRSGKQPTRKRALSKRLMISALLGNTRKGYRLKQTQLVRRPQLPRKSQLEKQKEKRKRASKP